MSDAVTAPVPEDLLRPRPPEGPSSSRQAMGLALLLAFFALLAVAGGPGVLVMVGLILLSVVIHELGHYLTAKASGMKVTEFFIGFGPRLWSFRRGETEYGVKPIWAGAYVKIVGMNNLDRVDPADEPRTYRQQPFWQRLITVLGGPLANVAFAFVLFAGLLVASGVDDDTDWVIDSVVEHTAADRAGIQPGDDIVSIGGKPVDAWEDLGAAVFEFPGVPMDVVVVRDGEELVLPAVVGEQLNEEAAPAIDGIARRDRLVALDGEPLAGYDDLRSRVAVGDEVAITVDRATPDGQRRIEVQATVVAPLPEDGVDGFLGVGPTEFGTDAISPPAAVDRAARATGSLVWDAGVGVVRVFSPSGIANMVDQVLTTEGADERDPDEAISTIIDEGAAEDRVISVLGVVQLGASATETFGVDAAIEIVAALNVFLAVLNLIPLLPFDGGHASIVLYEGVRSRFAGRRYHADVAKLLPVAYTVVAVFVSIGLAAIFLDATRPVAG